MTRVGHLCMVSETRSVISLTLTAGIACWEGLGCFQPGAYGHPVER